MFTYQPASAFYAGTLPLFDGLSGAMLVLGVVYSLWHTREPRFLLLNLWVAAAVLGAAVLVNPANAVYRVLIVLPAVAILAAVGVVKLVQVVTVRTGIIGARPSGCWGRSPWGWRRSTSITTSI